MDRHFKNFAAFAARFLKWVWPFYDIAKWRVHTFINNSEYAFACWAVNCWEVPDDFLDKAGNCSQLHAIFALMITIFVIWPLFPLVFALVPLFPLSSFLYQKLTMNHHNWCRRMRHRLHILLWETLEKFY